MTTSTLTTPTTPVAPAMVVEVTMTVKVAQTIDMVKTFTDLNEADQQRYVTMGIAELGFEFEYERPMAFLWPDEDDLIPFTMCPGDGFPNGDISDSDMRLNTRAGERVWGKDARWTEADFDTLVAAVPWMNAHYTRLRALAAMSDDDVARLPGPDDVALF